MEGAKSAVTGGYDKIFKWRIDFCDYIPIDQKVVFVYLC